MFMGFGTQRTIDFCPTQCQSAKIFTAFHELEVGVILGFLKVTQSDEGEASHSHERVAVAESRSIGGQQRID